MLRGSGEEKHKDRQYYCSTITASSKQGQRADAEAILMTDEEDDGEEECDISVRRIQEVMMLALVPVCAHESVCVVGWVCKYLINPKAIGPWAVLSITSGISCYAPETMG